MPKPETFYQVDIRNTDGHEAWNDTIRFWELADAVTWLRDQAENVTEWKSAEWDEIGPDLPYGQFRVDTGDVEYTLDVGACSVASLIEDIR